MTISEPIPVAEAIKAVHAAIEVCLAEGETLFRDHGWTACARAGYAGTLEYLLIGLEDFEMLVPAGSQIYAAVSPIVEWYRQTGAQGGRCSQCGQHGTHKMDCSKPGARNEVLVMGDAWGDGPDLIDRKGGDPEEWPASLRVREMPR